MEKTIDILSCCRDNAQFIDFNQCRACLSWRCYISSSQQTTGAKRHIGLYGVAWTRGPMATLICRSRDWANFYGQRRSSCRPKGFAFAWRGCSIATRLGAAFLAKGGVLHENICRSQCFRNIFCTATLSHIQCLSYTLFIYRCHTILPNKSSLIKKKVHNGTDLAHSHDGGSSDMG